MTKRLNITFYDALGWKGSDGVLDTLTFHMHNTVAH